MEDDDIVVSVVLSEINCGKCGGVYAINERYRRSCKETGTSWTCPYCKVGWGYAESDIDRIRRRADRAEQRNAQLRDELKSAQRSVAAQKANVTKLKRRASAGVCPCCNRTFQNLARHMKSQHPGYAEKETAA